MAKNQTFPTTKPSTTASTTAAGRTHVKFKHYIIDYMTNLTPKELKFSHILHLTSTHLVNIDKKVCHRFNHHLSIIHYQSSFIIYQLSIINHHLSFIIYQLSIINYQSSFINYRLSIINHHLSIINYQLPIIIYQLSIINH